MKRLCLNLTEELCDLLSLLAENSEQSFGEYVEDVLRSHPDVAAAAKKRKVKFTDRPKAGRRWPKSQ